MTRAGGVQVNPHKPLKHLYGARMMAQYRGAMLGELSPHVYAIAEQVGEAQPPVADHADATPFAHASLPRRCTCVRVTQNPSKPSRASAARCRQDAECCHAR